MESDQTNTTATSAITPTEADLAHDLPYAVSVFSQVLPTLRPGTDEHVGLGLVIAACRRAIAAEAELKQFKTGTYCAYCGHREPIDGDGERIAEHIRTCELHPMRAVEAEVTRLRDLLHRDRTGLAAGLARVRQIIRGWFWIGIPGDWGCYEEHERTEDNLRGEMERCLAEVEEAAMTALRESGDVAITGHQPQTVKELEASVKELTARVKALEAAKDAPSIDARTRQEWQFRDTYGE